MAQGFPSFGGAGVLLFDEDFDLPMRATEPEIIQPVFSAAELETAREDAAREGRDSALAEAEHSAQAAMSGALAAIAAQMTASREEAVSIAEQSAEAIARLLIDCFAAAFPALSARHGPEELAAVLREILPALRREPKITVRIAPQLMPDMADQIRTLDNDLAARIRLLPEDGLGAGDACVTWENGSAVRDTASLWGQIESILAPAGLLGVKITAKEPELVE